MSKIFNFLFVSLMLVACATGVSSIESKSFVSEEQTIEQMSDEMLELTKDSDQERTPAIYVVIISEPETITVTPPKK